MIFKILEALRKKEITLDSSAESAGLTVSSSSAKPPTLTEVLHEEAKGRFKEGTFDLTQDAINEAQENNFDPELYRKLLLKLRNSNFLTNNLFQSQALAEYQRGIIDLDKLIEENSIQRLAGLYSTHSSQMDTQRLLHLNSEVGLDEDGNTVLKKTTFVHQLFEQNAPRSAILDFFSKLNILAISNPDFVNGYLNLSDENGRSIRDIIVEKSISTSTFQAIDREIFTHNTNLPQQLTTQDNIQEDTHTSSIHGSVDESMVKLALLYDPSLTSQISNYTVKLTRNEQWKSKIDADLNKFESELKHIISSDKQIDEFFKPTLTKGDSIEHLRNKFKFQAKTALRLIEGLKNDGYNNHYRVSATGEVSSGLNPREIVAISYASLANPSYWHNQDQKSQHFIELVEHLYIAKRGYNIDRHGEDEWRTHPDSPDDNKCTGGMVNEVANGLRDHKLVKVKVITANTMFPAIIRNLPNILEQIAKDTKEVSKIQNWLDTGIIDKTLSDKIIESLKKNEVFAQEFSRSEIATIAPQVLNKYNVNQLRELGKVLSTRIPQLTVPLPSEQFDRSKISSFVYHKDKGYILYLENLYYKNPQFFEDSLKSMLTTISLNSLDSKDVIKTTLMVGLLLNSKDKKISDHTSQVFREYLSKIPQEAKDQYLVLSSGHGNSQIVEELISSGANVNARDTREGHFGITPLMIAAKTGQTKLVERLIELGANKEDKDEEGYTALMLAASRGKTQIVTKLIKLGADKDAKNNANFTALMLASLMGRTETVTKLVELGANKEVRDRKGFTPLIAAAQAGHTATVTELVKLGADLEARDKDERTALMYAAKAGHTATITELLKLGADLEARDRDERTALMYAAEAGPEQFSTLIKLGANEEAKDKRGRTYEYIGIKKETLEKIKAARKKLKIESVTEDLRQSLKSKTIFSAIRKPESFVGYLELFPNEDTQEMAKRYIKERNIDHVAKFIPGFGNRKTDFELMTETIDELKKALKSTNAKPYKMKEIKRFPEKNTKSHT